ncbi:MAG: HAD family hydrolase [Deltaproteobacteria bacterium]|nr:HAD family hydrolase [Deltaproteobacteria bacterium]
MDHLIKLVAFDCDGVLFDSQQANIAFYNAILAHFERPPLSPEAVDFIHSHTVWESLEYLFPGYPDLEAVLHFTRSFDYSPFIAMMVEEPHLREFLRFLRPGCYLALATNRTTTTRAVLTYHGLADDFDLVVSAIDVSRPKPHPESFVRILSHFRLSPLEAVYIGDSRVDEQFAANAGVPFVAYRNPGLTANYYLDSFAAGPDLIRGLVRNQSFQPRRRS